MNEDSPTIANLSPDELGEIQRIEQRLSERTGHTIALIAYDLDDRVQTD